MHAPLLVAQHVEAVRGFWAAYQARDWPGARALLAPGACCTWWTSGERFIGAEAVVHVNAVYPEGWHIEILAVEPLPDQRVLSLVRVDHGDQVHYAHSWFRFAQDTPPCIEAVEEFWATAGPPPAWREGLPGRERVAVRCTAGPR